MKNIGAHADRTDFNYFICIFKSMLPALTGQTFIEGVQVFTLLFALQSFLLDT